MIKGMNKKSYWNKMWIWFNSKSKLYENFKFLL